MRLIYVTLAGNYVCWILRKGTSDVKPWTIVCLLPSVLRGSEFLLFHLWQYFGQHFRKSGEGVGLNTLYGAVVLCSTLDLACPLPT
jgi:hypothetical protein